MSPRPAGTLEQKVAAAREILECLLSLCRGFESDEWLAKFVAVEEAMTAGRFKAAVFEEARLTTNLQPKWIVSRRLAHRLQTAMGVMHRHVSYPGHSEPVAEFAELPRDVTAGGTLEEESLRTRDWLRESYRIDPLEEDPAYADIMTAAVAQAEQEMAGEGHQKGSFGYCHFFWKRLKEILLHTYALEWRTPAELNRHITFD